MKVTYDAEMDTLRIVLNDQQVAESDEDKPGIIIDYDAQGNIVRIKILDPSKWGISPHGVEYAITGLKGA